MPAFASRSLRTSLVTSFIGLAALSAPACEPMGGCPWVETSDVDIDPGASCLQLFIPEGDSSTPLATGGCVNPVLFGRNECNVPLVIEASPEGAWPAQTVLPGDFLDLEVRLDGNVGTQGSRIDFEVHGQLGESPVVIRFSTFEPD